MLSIFFYGGTNFHIFLIIFFVKEEPRDIKDGVALCIFGQDGAHGF